MKKKGQITIFIFIGIIIILIATLVIFRFDPRRNIKPNNYIHQEKIERLNQFVSFCVKNIGKQALLILGDQGRIYPQAFISTDDSKISYFYYQGIGFFPYKLAFLEEDLSQYIKENIDLCLNDFSNFNFEINTQKDDLVVKSDFNVNDVTIKVHYPITIKIEDSQTTIKDFESRINLQFPPIFDLSKEIYKKTRSDPEWIDIDFLYNQPYEIKLIKIDDKTLVYEIIDKSQQIDGQVFVYRFAMKFKL